MSPSKISNSMKKLALYSAAAKNDTEVIEQLDQMCAAIIVTHIHPYSHPDRHKAQYKHVSIPHKVPVRHTCTYKHVPITGIVHAFEK